MSAEKTTKCPVSLLSFITLWPTLWNVLVNRSIMHLPQQFNCMHSEICHISSYQQYRRRFLSQWDQFGSVANGLQFSPLKSSGPLFQVSLFQVFPHQWPTCLSPVALQLWMMSEEDLDEIVQITVEDFAQGDQTGTPAVPSYERPGLSYSLCKGIA